MKALIQRVKRAEVRVEGETIASIGYGLLILLGVGELDNEEQAEWLARKCAELRIFDDPEGKLNCSILEAGGEALVVPQFTLYADPRKGRRPSYATAAPSEVAEAMFEIFCEYLDAVDIPPAKGRFGADMEVELVNDGPVTLMVESPAG
jgi:D-tyrosyl-tRNA(Tyr) deacylase